MNRTRTRIAIAAALLALGLTLASCAATTTQPHAGGQSPAGQTNTGSREPGVNGRIAAVSGTTMQLQSTGQQTAVTWTSSTPIRAQQTVTRAALKVGDCISARAGGDAAGTATPAAGPITATTVQVLTTTGGCTFTGDGSRPSSSPSPAASPRPDRFGGGVIGTISALNATSVTVTPMDQTSDGPQTVQTTATTTYTEQVKGTAKDLVVGRCVEATGTSDSTGTVAATMVTVRPATNGQCVAGSGLGAGRQGSGSNGQSNV